MHVLHHKGLSLPLLNYGNWEMTEKYSDFYKCFFIRLPAGTKYLHRKTRTNNLMFLFPCFECHENLTKDCFFTFFF